VFAEGRFVADVGHGVVEGGVQPRARDIDADLGELFLDRSEVERGHGVFAAHAQAGRDGSIGGKPTAHQPCRQAHTTGGEQFADARARYPLAADDQGRQHIQPETVLPGELSEDFDVA
jgi:hypothetical protein